MKRKATLPRVSKGRVDNSLTGLDLLLCMELSKNSYLRYNFKKYAHGTDTAFKTQSCNPDSLRASRQEANWEEGD